MPSWLDPLNAVSAVPLQILGFVIAIRQIIKAKNAAEAARDAATVVATQIESNMLLVVLPQLNQVETNLEWAVAHNDRDAAIHYLGAWRWQAGQARGLMIERKGIDDFLSLLQTSIATAAETKLALQDASADVLKRCKPAQKAIAAVTGSVGELTAKHSFEGTSRRGTSG